MQPQGHGTLLLFILLFLAESIDEQGFCKKVHLVIMRLRTAAGEWKSRQDVDQ